MAVRRFSGIDTHDRTRSGHFPHMGAYFALKSCPKLTTISPAATKQIALTNSGDGQDSEPRNVPLSGSLDGTDGGETVEQTESAILRPKGGKLNNG
jgi:hypothetical protein